MADLKLTSMPQNFTNTVIDLFNTLDTYPRNALKTGTMSSNGNVVTGNGTAFKTELDVGQFLYNGTDEIRRIDDIESDTRLTIRLAFTVPMAAAAVRAVKPGKVRQLSVLAVSGTPSVMGATGWVPLAEGESVTWSDYLIQGNECDPVLIDAAGTITHVVALK